MIQNNMIDLDSFGTEIDPPWVLLNLVQVVEVVEVEEIEEVENVQSKNPWLWRLDRNNNLHQ